MHRGLVWHAIKHCCSNNELWYREDGLLSNSSSSGIGLDWFEGALVRPDNVLSDVAHAINASSVSRVCFEMLNLTYGRVSFTLCLLTVGADMHVS